MQALPRASCDPHKSYIITGGLGGFGLELSGWLVERGARHIVLTSRSGVQNGYQDLCLRRWRDNGVNVVISTKNIKHLAETEELVTAAAEMAPVGGIFHLAMVGPSTCPTFIAK